MKVSLKAASNFIAKSTKTKKTLYIMDIMDEELFPIIKL